MAGEVEDGGRYRRWRDEFDAYIQYWSTLAEDRDDLKEKETFLYRGTI